VAAQHLIKAPFSKTAITTGLILISENSGASGSSGGGETNVR
jgi:hypothetical protein